MHDVISHSFLLMQEITHPVHSSILSNFQPDILPQYRSSSLLRYYIYSHMIKECHQRFKHVLY